MPQQVPNTGILGLAAALRQAAGTGNATTSRILQNPAGATANQAATVATALATDANVTRLQLFAGFLGGAFTQPTDTTGVTWQLLYLDPKLLSWLLVDTGALLYSQNVPNQTTAFGSYDYVWVRADGSVSQGEGSLQPNEVQARYMRGAFVSAADFAASVTGGTYAPQTGPLCPLTPGCCGIRTR